MTVNTAVELKIDEKTLSQATAILARVGLTLSDALRLTLEEIVRARYFNLAPPTGDEALFDLDLEYSSQADAFYGAAGLEDLLKAFQDGPKGKK